MSSLLAGPAAVGFGNNTVEPNTTLLLGVRAKATSDCDGGMEHVLGFRLSKRWIIQRNLIRFDMPHPKNIAVQ